MVATAVALIVIGVVLGLFFPVMFVASLAGLLLLIGTLVAVGRRATTASPPAEDPTPDRPE